MTQTASQPALSYLDPATLAAIGSLELRARMIVEGVMTGMHRSPYQGYSVEFAQHRQYAPGDDLRHLDWKVYGKTDKLYLKQYQKETNLDLILIVDASGSMAYGSDGATKRRSDEAGASSDEGERRRSEGGEAPSLSVASSPRRSVAVWRKYDHAASIAAAMAYLSLRQQDRVGLVTMAGRVLHTSRMSNTHDHWRTVIEMLNAVAPHGEAPADGAEREAMAADEARVTDLARVFDQVLAKVGRRSLVVLISDLFDAAESLDRACARLHHRRHDLLVLQTLDPAERTFPFRTPSDFIGLEAEGRLGLDPAAVRQAYLDALRGHLDKVEQTTRRFRFDYLLLDTGESLGPPMAQFLARRAASLSKGS